MHNPERLLSTIEAYKRQEAETFITTILNIANDPAFSSSDASSGMEIRISKRNDTNNIGFFAISDMPYSQPEHLYTIAIDFSIES